MSRKKKGGRPPLSSRTQLTIHLTKGQLRRIEAIRKKEELVSRSAAIREVLDFGIELYGATHIR